MKGKFILADEMEREILDWGQLGWISRPPNTGAAHITVIEVRFNPGGGHNFHKHPDQEETITVIEGQIEQWLEDEKRMLGPGDSIFIGADVVHASFNVSDGPAVAMVTLGPCVGDGGYEVVEVGDEEPWKSLR
ncbi:MAG: cupin domain-containing protein [Candidatus Promineifilaceae bacterium]|nr:cupin domain-containing protein [Candidatus Promineifilaceae bacterium]